MKDGDLSNTFSPVVLIFWCAVHEIFTFEGYTRLNIWTISENHIISHKLQDKEPSSYTFGIEMCRLDRRIM